MHRQLRVRLQRDARQRLTGHNDSELECAFLPDNNAHEEVMIVCEGKRITPTFSTRERR